MAERVADPPQAAARLGQLVGAGRRGRRRPLLVLRLRRLRGGRPAAPLRQRDRRLPDRRAHPRLRAALHRSPGGRARAVLPLARLSPTALGDRPRRRRRQALLRRPACRPREPAERDPAAALRAPLPARPGPPVALLRRARRLRQAEADQPPAAALRSRPRDDRPRLPLRAGGAAGARRRRRRDRRPAPRHRTALEHGDRLPRRPGRDGRRAPDQARQERPLRGGDRDPADDPRPRGGPEPRRGPGREPRHRRHPARVRGLRGSARARPLGRRALPGARARGRASRRRPGGADRGPRQRRQVAPRVQGPLLRRRPHQRYAYFEYRRANYDAIADGIGAPIGAGRTLETELYDLSRDPDQLRNLARDSRYSAPRRELAGLLGRLENCEGPECVVSSPVSPPRR